MNLPKPFARYVSVQEMKATGDIRRFVFTLPFQNAGTDEQGSYGCTWNYSRTQEEIDKKASVEGLAQHREKELARFEKWVDEELARIGGRLYEVEGQEILVRGY